MGSIKQLYEMYKLRKEAKEMGLLCTCDFCMGPNPAGELAAIKKLRKVSDMYKTNGKIV